MTNAYQSTSLVVMFKAFLDTDHVTEATSKTIAITISKNGGAFGNPNAGATNATEVSSGWYKFTLDTTDTNTVGPLAYRGTNADIDDVGGAFYVIPVPATQASVDTIDDFLDTEIAAIKAKTDNLPSDPADASDIATAFAAVPNAVWTNGTRTLTSGAAPSAADIADAVWDEDLTGHTTVDSAGQLVADTAAGINGIVSAVNAVPAGVWAEAIDGATTAAESMRLQNSALGGKLSGAGTGTETARDLADTKDRLVYTVDSSGNRTAVTRTLT